MSDPRVTVVVPTLNEERRIEACLASIRAQTYPRDLVEIVVVDGGSTDRTVEILRGIPASDLRIRVLHNPERIQAAGFNLAIRASTADVVSLVSAHSELEPSFLRECVDEMVRSGADNVGGRMEAIGDGTVQRAIAAAMHSPLGVGGASYHYADAPRDIPSAWPGCFRRDVFERVGLFDARLAVHEDYELNHRIRASGGRVRFSPRIGAAYHVRPSLRAFGRQYLRYGRAKSGVARETPGVVRPYHLAPPLLVAALGAGAVSAPFWRPARLGLAAIAAVYAAGLGGGAVLAGRRERAAARALVPVVLGVMHLSWGAGFWIGVVAGPPLGPAARRAATPAA